MNDNDLIRRICATIYFAESEIDAIAALSSLYFEIKCSNNVDALQAVPDAHRCLMRRYDNERYERILRTARQRAPGITRYITAHSRQRRRSM